ncbi:MAG: hypothetical protein QOE86_595 [Solirubrobacteraceae bacterium]|jgi:ribosomal protein S27AE|nr:hypothetical protein [Solirubrobacteraceae bacterium]
MERPPASTGTLVLRLAPERLADGLELVEAPLPPGEAALRIPPRYACGSCNLVLFAGAPLAHLLPRGRRPSGVRCPRCAAVNLTQVNGRLSP